ncbi:MAG: type restriction enzyme protein [Mycobacterium sp.]|jgi:hypothetical protein|nr:type restriction enzyme protein [Mycobacterium sp.]
MSESRRLVDKLWSYCNVLRDDGVGVIEYTEQLTYLLFLKMAHERATRKLNPQKIVPNEFSWQKLLDAEGTDLEVEYTQILVGLAQQPGTLGTIYRKAQNRIQDPAKLKRLIVDLIDKENWSASGTDIKGDAYEDCSPRVPLTRVRVRASTSPRVTSYGRSSMSSILAPSTPSSTPLVALGDSCSLPMNTSLKTLRN